MDRGQPDAGDELIASFTRWAAAERAAGAAEERVRVRRLRDEAAGGATWTGVLVDLAEAGAPVSVVTGSAKLSGRIAAVCSDFCVVLPRSGHPVLIPTERLAGVWPHQAGGPTAQAGGLVDPAGRGPATGSRFPSLDLTLAAALSRVAEERSPVRVTIAGGHQITGELIGVGENVISVRADAARQQVAHLALSCLEACELR